MKTCQYTRIHHDERRRYAQSSSFNWKEVLILTRSGEHVKLTQAEVDEVLVLVVHIASEVASDDAVPCWVVLLVKLLLDVGGDVLFNDVLPHSRGGVVFLQTFKITAFMVIAVACMKTFTSTVDMIIREDRSAAILLETQLWSQHN